MTYILSFRFDGDTEGTDVKFGMEIDHIHTYLNILSQQLNTWQRKESFMLYSTNLSSPHNNNSIQINSFIYVLDNSQIRPITAKH
jgi:hypothetical protein